MLLHMSLLACAAQWNNTAHVQSLLDAGGDVNEQDVVR